MNCTVELLLYIPECFEICQHNFQKNIIKMLETNKHSVSTSDFKGRGFSVTLL